MNKLQSRAILFATVFLLITILFWLGGTDFTNRSFTLAFWWFCSIAFSGLAATYPLILPWEEDDER